MILSQWVRATSGHVWPCTHRAGKEGPPFAKERAPVKGMRERLRAQERGSGPQPPLEHSACSVVRERDTEETNAPVR